MKDLKTLKSIFEGKIFRIPDYQRGYAWSTIQIKEFWEDLMTLSESRYHYTGVLTLKEVEKEAYKNWTDERWLIEDRGYKAFYVVDGQQRLTTFVIFIQSLIEVITELPENKGKQDQDIYLGTFNVKEIKENYLCIIKPPEGIIKTFNFGYETDNPSFQFLRHNIFNEPDPGSIKETFYTLNLENAKLFLKDNIEAVYKEGEISELSNIFKKLTIQLMFNVFEIGDDFDVYVAFETMNNRGKKLSNLELLKNRLIYLTTLYEKQELDGDECIVLRDIINDSWKEVYHHLGKNKKSPLNDDDFLSAHWIMYFQYTRAKGDDYIKYLLEKHFTPKNIFEKIEVKTEKTISIEEVKSISDEYEEDEPNGEETIVEKSKLSPNDIKTYVNSLKSAVVHWFNIHYPNKASTLTEEERLWLDRLNRIGIGYFRPLITSSFLAKNITYDERVKLFQAIERFIFLTFRLARAFSTYRNSEFYKAARLLRTGAITIDTVIENLEERMEWCFHEDGKFKFGVFKENIEKSIQDGGGYYHWNGLRYFLFEYEYSKVRKRGNEKIEWELFIKSAKDKVSIEHIYPQTPDKKCWKVAFKGRSHKQKNILCNSLGNLVPLSLSINSSLQNDCFKDKKEAKLNDEGKKIRAGYSDGSHSEIEVSQNEDWTPNEIRDRGLYLLEFLEKRWDVKIGSNEDKMKMLCLDFMLESE